MFGAVDQAYTHNRTKGDTRVILDKSIGLVGQLPAKPGIHSAPPTLAHARPHQLPCQIKYVKRVNSPRLKKQVLILNELFQIRSQIN